MGAAGAVAAPSARVNAHVIRADNPPAPRAARAPREPQPDRTVLLRAHKLERSR